MKAQKLNLYVVDDDEAVRRSLVMLLFPGGHAVQSFDSGEAFLEAVDPDQPGCVILDLRLGGISGVEVFERLRVHRSPLVVLFLSGHGDIPVAMEAKINGAFDWIVKPDTAHLLDKLAPALQWAAERGEATQRWHQLQAREKEVAGLVATGAPNKEIARQLSPSCAPRTVETHRARIFEKLDLANAAELHGWMLRHAWLTDFGGVAPT